jgi:hypothetical protein
MQGIFYCPPLLPRALFECSYRALHVECICLSEYFCTTPELDRKVQYMLT